MLATLGIESTKSSDSYAEWNDFSLASESTEKPVTRRLHVAFVAPSRIGVAELWRVGTEAAHSDDGAPGERPRYSPDYDGAFVLDPDGNNVEVVCHNR